MTTVFRNTMTDLVDEVRRLIGDPRGDDAIWRDVDVQDALDDHRIDLYRAPLVWEPTFTSTTVQYLSAVAPHDHFEQTLGGTAVFVVENATGADVGTASYTPDYRQGVVTFAADQQGTAYYLTGRSYDVYGAAADVLDWWGALDPADCLTDENGRRYFDTTRAKGRAMLAKQYRNKSRPAYAALVRGDVA